MNHIIIVENPIRQAEGENLSYNFYTELSVKPSNSHSSAPGLTSCISQFTAFFDAFKGVFQAIRIHDGRQFVEELIRVCNLPLGIATSIERIVLLITYAAYGISIASLALSATVMGLIFLTIELGLEVYRLTRALLFSSTYQIKTITKLVKELEDKAIDLDLFIKKHHKELDLIFPKQVQVSSHLDFQEKLIDASITKICKNYFKLTESEKIGSEKRVYNRLQSKINELSRIIRPSILAQFNQKISDFQNSSKEKSIKDKKELLFTLDKQINKTLIVHTIGIAAIILATISIVFTHLAFPPLLPITIGLIGIAVEFGRYFAPQAWLDQKGYQFSFRACLPKCLNR
jgi:hypothetical protein